MTKFVMQSPISRAARAACVALLGAATLAGCAAHDAQAGAEALTPRQLALLEDNLGGKAAGEPQTCLPGPGRNVQTIRVSDDILLYRVSSNLVYRNDLNGGCPGLARDNDVIVTDIRGVGPCRGDIIRLVDRASGIQGPSCVLGDFTPYRAVREEAR